MRFGTKIMAKYRKKPTIVEAFQLTLGNRWPNKDWPEWAHEAWQKGPGEGGLWPGTDAYVEYELCCGANERVMHITFGWWIIRGIEGEIYTCKPGIFEQTYEKIED